MKKIFTRILGATLGLAMAAGASFGIANAKKANPAYAAPIVAFSFSKSGSTINVTSGYQMVLTNYSSGSDKNYYQDKNGSVGLDIGVKKSTGTIWSETPASISLTVSVGGGSTKDPLGHNVVANLIDSSGNAIVGTDVTVTTKVETTTGKDYTVSVPVANNAAGIMIHHEKESGYNLRVYTISLSYVTAGAQVESVSVTGTMSETSYTTVDTWSNAGLTSTVTMSDSSEYTGQTLWSYAPTTPAAAVIANSGNEVTGLSVTATATAGGESGSKATEGISVSYATVADGLSAIPNLNDQITGAIVRGKVSYIDNIDPTTYHNATYFISDDGTRTNELEVFRGRGVDNVDITNVNDIKVGDVVLVYGNLEYHDGNPDVQEFLANNYLLSLDRPVSQEPEITITEAGFTMKVGDNDVTLHATAENIPDGGSAKWVSGTPAVATINESTGVIHAVAPGQTTITAKIVDSGDNMVASNSIVVKVIQDLLSADDTFVIRASYNDTSYYLTGVSINNLGTVSTTESDAMVFTAIAHTEPGQFRLKNKASGNYLSYSGSEAKLFAVNSGEASSTLWKAYSDGTKNIVESVDVAGRSIQFNYNNGNSRFACYTSATPIIIEKVTVPVVNGVTVTGDATANANNEFSISKNFSYVVSYVDPNVTGTSAVNVSVLNSADKDEGASVIASPSNGSFTVLFYANDTFTITVTSAEDQAISDSVSISVSNVYLTGFALYQGTGEPGQETLIEGDYVFYYNGKALKAGVENNRAQNETVTPSENVISTSLDTVIWHVAPVGNYYTIYNAAEGKYLASTDLNVKNQIQLTTEGTEDKAKWAVTISEGKFEFENLARQSGDTPENKWLRNNGNSGWACYSSSTGGSISLYRMDMAGYIKRTSSISAILGTESAGVVNSLSIGFAGSISKVNWDSINADNTITRYGIMLIREATLTAHSKSSIADAYNDGELAAQYKPNDVYRDYDGSVQPFLDGNDYVFSVKVTGLLDSDYSTVFCAAPYIVAGGQYYFFQEMRWSVSDLAAYCIANGGSNLSNQALGTLIA